MSEDNVSIPFSALGLSEGVQQALRDVGYEVPSPIQAATIPLLMAGRDVLGQAQTGTGKTAAFALPILSRIDIRQKTPQGLVLAPTRELAIQVAEAFQRYAAHIPGFHVLPIYGGQSYEPQLRGLKRGAHVVVGTPGRVKDHLNRRTMDLSQLRHLVLDEADEMLRMGFIDDIDWILQQMPETRQTALFSATMPTAIRRIAQAHLRDPETIRIASKTTTAENIRQRYWRVSGMSKLDALTRILEVEDFDAMIIFARTRVATDELATRLSARGFAASALNGDLAQNQRERIVSRLRDGHLDILVATDVAARGLDVSRITHIINYDVPTDPEAYTHRIGRTGRAGRSGEAILFIAPREQHLLKLIERTTRQPIEPMALPTIETVNDQRAQRFLQKIDATLAEAPHAMSAFRGMLHRHAQANGLDMTEVAAALAHLLQGDTPLMLAPGRDERPARSKDKERSDKAPRERTERGPRDQRDQRDASSPAASPRTKPKKKARRQEERMESYRLAVGKVHGVEPGNIVGALANEAGLDSSDIGRVEIFEDHSTVELPEGMPKPVYKHLQTVWVAGQQLRIARMNAAAATGTTATPSHAVSEKPSRPTSKRPDAKKPKPRPRD